MKKAELRKKYLGMRMALPAQEIEKLEDLILINFQKLNIEIPVTILSYLPMADRNEYNPYLVEEYCRFKTFDRQNLCYPLMMGDGLQAVRVDEDFDVETAQFGVPQPVGGVPVDADNIGLVIVPLITFDQQGNRVGYGKGYYDRYFRHTPPDVLKIGFSFFDPVNKIGYVDANDIKLDHCVTPYDHYSFN